MNVVNFERHESLFERILLLIEAILSIIVIIIYYHHNSFEKLFTAAFDFIIQKQRSRGVLIKRFYENI